MHHKGYTKVDEALQEYIELDERLQKEEEIEFEEARKIAESGIKKIVPNLVYGDHFDPSNCVYCMNYNFEADTCKKNMPNINPWYTKDNNLPSECPEWDYIYKTEDEK